MTGPAPTPQGVHGIHHVTCIAGDPQRNLDFYTGVLGLRMVKRSVNQDAPDTYHLFYADGEGRPGTDLTFFPWPDMRPARRGTGHALEVGFSVPEGSLDWWAERLAGAPGSVGGTLGEPEERHGERALTLRDPDGLPLVLVEASDPLDTVPWAESPVPEERQLRGFHGVRLLESDLDTTARFLTEVLGFEAAGRQGDWYRFGAGGGGASRWIEVREQPGGERGAWGTGGVHHVAFRVEDDGEQLAVRERVARVGVAPTAVIDRFWFHSVYFREPGGVLFELATEGPGFTADEDLAHLGEELILPPWLEPQRAEIEAGLQPLRYEPGS
jgi:glyoxalase family protein